ncbi:MAG: DUF1566 domain-containing protein [Elusimicrobiota bacterium]
MKARLLLSAVVLLVVLSFPARSYAGSLQPSGPPSNDATRMFTLEQIYVKVTSGTAPTKQSGGFRGPTAGPGAGTMHTLTAHELPDTGQTTVYSTNDDGTYMPAANQPSYTMYNYTGGSLVETSDVNVSSVTVDNRTGLMWATDAGLVASSSWTVAITNCENLSYAGYTDWRLPNVKELMSIVNYQNYNPSIDTTKFRNTVSNYYWTSTTYAAPTTNAWVVGFSDGFVDYGDKTGTYYVRPVRGGP